jgi:hypothetical protein
MKLAVFVLPPETDEPSLLAVLLRPPETEEKTPLAVLSWPATSPPNDV